MEQLVIDFGLLQDEQDLAEELAELFDVVTFDLLTPEQISDVVDNVASAFSTED